MYPTTGAEVSSPATDTMSTPTAEPIPITAGQETNTSPPTVAVADGAVAAPVLAPAPVQAAVGPAAAKKTLTAKNIKTKDRFWRVPKPVFFIY